jgi:hypothetical protein
MFHMKHCSKSLSNFVDKSLQARYPSETPQNSPVSTILSPSRGAAPRSAHRAQRRDRAEESVCRMAPQRRRRPGLRRPERHRCGQASCASGCRRSGTSGSPRAAASARAAAVEHEGKCAPTAQNPPTRPTPHETLLSLPALTTTPLQTTTSPLTNALLRPATRRQTPPDPGAGHEPSPNRPARRWDGSPAPNCQSRVR